LTFNPARGGFAGSLPQPMITIEPAAEGDLLDLERSLMKNGSGADLVAVRELLRIVRDEPAEPLAIQILNADQIGTAPRVMTVRRNDSGRLTGAVVATP
jgi:hypothetical protein